MTRVLFFNYEYPPLGGGAGNATAYILREFSQIPNLRVDLVTSSIDEKYHLEKIGDNIELHRLPIGKNKNNMHFQSQKDLLMYTWRAWFFSKKLLKKNKYDLTHSFFTVPCGVLSLWWYWRYKIPFIVSLRGSDVPGYSDRFGLIYKMLTPLIVYIWKKANFVVANSLEFKKLALKSNSKQKINIITNGVDIEEFSAKEIETEKRNDLEELVKNEQFKIICGSRITHRKGFRFIVRALQILNKKGIKVNLDIIGDGNEKEELVELVEKLKLKEQVNFLGVIKHADLPKYYIDANVYVSASLNEGMSNTTLEALSSGLPIVATQTGGTDETTIDGKNGFIVKMKSAEDIAEKIEIILQDKDLENRMSKASRQMAEKMSWKNIAKEYNDLYEQI